MSSSVCQFLDTIPISISSYALSKQHGHWVTPMPIVEFGKHVASQLRQDCFGVEMAALVSCANCITDDIKIKADTHWFSPARFWLLLLAEPGAKKSALYKRVTGFWQGANAMAEDEYKAAMKEYRKEMNRYNRKLKAAHKQGIDYDIDAPQEPDRNIPLLNNFTPEALEKFMVANSRGIFFPSEEVSIILEQMASSKTSGFTSAMLQLADGGYRPAALRLSSTRASCKNYSGGIMTFGQPDVVIRAQDPKGHQRLDLVSNGFIQRFIPVFLADETVMFNRDSEKKGDDDNSEVTEQLEKLQAGLFALKGNGKHVEMSKEGLDLFKFWVDYKLPKIHRNPLFPASLKQHLCKYPGFILRLILTYHCINCIRCGVHPTEMEVDQEDVTSVLEIFTNKLLPQAIKVYGTLIRDEDSSLYLADKMMNYLKRWSLTSQPENTIVLRDFQQKVWLFKKASEEVRQRAVDYLLYTENIIEHGKTERGVRLYRLNSNLFPIFKAEHEDYQAKMSAGLMEIASG